jgi:hypothetical protein
MSKLDKFKKLANEFNVDEVSFDDFDEENVVEEITLKEFFQQLAQVSFGTSPQEIIELSKEAKRFLAMEAGKTPTFDLMNKYTKYYPNQHNENIILVKAIISGDQSKLRSLMYSDKDDAQLAVELKDMGDQVLELMLDADVVEPKKWRNSPQIQQAAEIYRDMISKIKMGNNTRLLVSVVKGIEFKYLERSLAPEETKIIATWYLKNAFSS